MEKILHTIKSYPIFHLFTLSLRYLIGGAFLFASLPKMFGERFTQISPDNPVGAYFECLYQMPLYWNFLGLSQALAGFLLITQRFALLGAMLFFGIILNIHFITLSLNMRGTPVVTFLMLLAIVWLLFWDFDKWKYIFLPSSSIVQVKIEAQPGSNVHLWIYAGLGILLLATGILLLSFSWNLILWLGISMVEVILAFGLSFYFHKKGRPLKI